MQNAPACGRQGIRIAEYEEVKVKAEVKVKVKVKVEKKLNVKVGGRGFWIFLWKSQEIFKLSGQESEGKN